VTVLDALDAAALRRWCESGAAALRAERNEIDDLNVYPVPDGDTGTNLCLTMQSVTDAVREAFEDRAGEGPDGDCTLGGAGQAMARGALLGARGNSGIILAQLLRGLADVFADAAPPVGGRELQAALCRAADLGYTAVSAPVEGTVLSVARAAAESAAQADPVSLAEVVKAAATGAAEALERTPTQLEALAVAGVVDAGGRGLCVLLDALLGVVDSSFERVARAHEEHRAGGPHRGAALPVARDRSGLATAREGGSPEFDYEVQYLLGLTEPAEDALARLRRCLDDLGDSLVVIGGDGLYAVHVHVNDVGAAVEAGVVAGRPWRITVTRFAEQVAEQEAQLETGQAATAPPPEKPAPEEKSARAVVVVTPGNGIAELVASSGATPVLGGATSHPSTAELLAAVRHSGATEVLVLPADSAEHATASAAAELAREEGVTVQVVPSRSVTQALAALAVADPQRPFADDAVSMSAAAAATRWAEVCPAVRRAQTSAGVCEPGDVLGLVEGDVVLIGSELESVARDLLDRMLLSGGELVTLVTGADADPGLADALVEHLHVTHPGVDAVPYEGGQPGYPLLVGVE
jgi:uncharacterized protein